MKLLDEIIEMAADDKEPVGNLLRKCLVLERQLQQVGSVDGDARRFVAATGTQVLSHLRRIPFAASDMTMIRFRRSQSNPERYRIYLETGCGTC